MQEDAPGEEATPTSQKCAGLAEDCDKLEEELPTSDHNMNVVADAAAEPPPTDLQENHITEPEEGTDARAEAADDRFHPEHQLQPPADANEPESLQEHIEEVHRKNGDWPDM